MYKVIADKGICDWLFSSPLNQASACESQRAAAKNNEVILCSVKTFGQEQTI